MPKGAPVRAEDCARTARPNTSREPSGRMPSTESELAGWGGRGLMGNGVRRGGGAGLRRATVADAAAAGLWPRLLSPLLVSLFHSGRPRSVLLPTVRSTSDCSETCGCCVCGASSPPPFPLRLPVLLPPGDDEDPSPSTAPSLPLTLLPSLRCCCKKTGPAKGAPRGGTDPPPVAAGATYAFHVGVSSADATNAVVERCSCSCVTIACARPLGTAPSDASNLLRR